MAKKSCEKHKKFNYYCEDCQAANIVRGARFNYNLFKKNGQYKKLILLIIVVVAIIASIAIFWWWPSWYGNINLQDQLYSIKAGGIDFFDFYFLNGWSTNFIFNRTALVGAVIGSVIMSLPPERNLLTIIGTKLRFGKPSRLKALIFWWTIGFVMFYLLGLLLDINNGGFSWTIYLIENGQIQITPNILLDAFAVLFDSTNKDFVTIFIYSYLILPVVTFIFGVLILRLVLNIVKNIYLRKNDYYVISNAFLIIGLLCGLGFFFVATLPLDGIGIIQIWAVILGFITMTSLGIFMYLYGKMQFEKDSANYIFSRYKQKKIIYVIVIVIAFTLTPLIFSIGPTLTLSDTTVWNEQQWIKKFNREIEWTSACAGLDMFEERPISNFTESSTTSDAVMVSQVRQFDQGFAVQYLANKIGTTFEGLADSDIVYIDDKEYWVAPKTVRFSEISGDAVHTNTEIYDHVEGFLAMDTFTGEEVNVSLTFNITENYPIFFGESESQRYLEQTLGYYDTGAIGAYDSDILLYTGWAGKIPNNDFIYEGEPDGALTGLEGFWKTLNIGLFAYAFETKHEYLINRNVRSRVEQILLPQLRIDNDPYLVFNIPLGKMYYAVSIYTHINIGSYAQYPILRFLGVSLVDVISGEMTFIENPSLDPIGDPTSPLWEIYLTKYDWQSVEDSDFTWLKPQLRYPEDLFELQLEANYKYHVKDSQTWKRGDDFHERPEDGNLFYIESDLGNGIEYIGLDLVEYKGQTAVLLAGIYVVRHGDHFGEAIFYHTRGSNLIGPRTARETYGSEATQEITLISGARHGNTLIYPLGGSIYYYVPTYSTAGTVQELKLAGFVEAFTRNVGYGENAQDAYDNLNLTEGETTSNVSISYNFDMETSMTYPNNPANFEITLQNYDTNFSAPGLDVKVNLSIYTQTTTAINYSLILPPDMYPIENTTYIDGDFTGVNFTIINTTLYFGQGLVLNGFLNTTRAGVILYFKWTLVVGVDIIYQSQEKLLYVY